MPVMQAIIEKAEKVKKTIVLPEGQDPRVVKAAFLAQKDGIANIVVLGYPEEIQESCRLAGISKINFKVITPKKSNKFSEYAEEFYKIRKDKGLTREESPSLIKGRIMFGAMMCRLGDADGLVAGSVSTTSEMLKAVFAVVEKKDNIRIGSSSFLMNFPNKTPSGENALIFSDCAVNVDPSAEDMVDIAIASSNTYRYLTGKKPKIAFLSFSTNGSGKSDSVDKVRKAIALTKKKIQEEKLNVCLAEKEMQADVAISPDVARVKAPQCDIKGDANVLIFPDLDTGNIAYKLVERLSGASAIGPIIQGLKRPVNDLSRGCSAKDIYDLIAVTVCQAI